MQDHVWTVLCGDHSTETNNLVEGAMEVWTSSMLEEGANLDPMANVGNFRNFGVAKEMIKQYIIQRREFLESIELIACEQPFAVPLTEEADLFFVGRLDKQFRLKGRVYVGEHKTTSLYDKKAKFRKNFIDSFSPNAQVDGYLYSGFLTHGKEFKGVWVDAALVHKTVHDGFRFIPIEKPLSMLDSWHHDTLYYIRRIQEEKRKLAEIRENDPESEDHVLRCFPKNPDACQDFGRNCTYREECVFEGNPERILVPPEGMIVQKWEPFDELRLETLGLKK